jgi:hypothetical protein
MKAPNKHGAGMQWKKVCGALTKQGVDANAVMLGKDKLRSELERQAARYAEINSIPMLIAAKEYSEAAHALVEFGQRHYAGYTVSDPGMQAETPALEAVEAELLAKLPKLPELLKLRAKLKGKPAEKNMRDRYWYELVCIWRNKIKPLASRKLRRKDLARFLIACTGCSDSEVKHFLDRRLNKLEARHDIDDPN